MGTDANSVATLIGVNCPSGNVNHLIVLDNHASENPWYDANNPYHPYFSQQINHGEGSMDQVAQ